MDRQQVVSSAAEYIAGLFATMYSGQTVGAEFEFPLVDARGKVMDAGPLFEKLIEAYGWGRIESEFFTIGARDSQSGWTVVYEFTTYMVEFNAPVSQNLLSMETSFNEVVSIVAQAARELGCYLLGYGAHPIKRPDLCEVISTPRYKQLKKLLPPGIFAFGGIASGQAHLAIPPDKIVQAMMVMNALSGVFMAPFVNCGWLWGELDSQHRLAVRETKWACLGRERTGIFPIQATTLEEIVEHILDQELFYWINAQNQIEGVGQGKTALQFILEQGLTTEREIYDHVISSALTTHWYNSRMAPKFGTIEMRPVCAQMPGEQFGPIAFMIGVAANLDEAQKLVDRYSLTFWKRVKDSAISEGLAGKVGQFQVTDLVRDVLGIAQRGLQGRGYGEEKLLEVISGRLDNPWTVPAYKALQTIGQGTPAEMRAFVEQFSFKAE